MLWNLRSMNWYRPLTRSSLRRIINKPLTLLMMNNPTNIHSLQTNFNPNKTHLQPTLSIASSNIVSFTDYTKRFQIINESLSNNIDILGLLETNLTTKQSKFIHKEILPNYHSFFNSAPNKCRETEVAILLKPTIHSHVIKSKGNM